MSLLVKSHWVYFSHNNWTENPKWGGGRDRRTREVCLWCEITEENERMTLVFPLDSYVVCNVFISHMVFYRLVFRLSCVYCLTLTCALDFITLVIFGEYYKLQSVLLRSAVCLSVCLPCAVFGWSFVLSHGGRPSATNISVKWTGVLYFSLPVLRQWVYIAERGSKRNSKLKC